jgi:hypothetical protein
MGDPFLDPFPITIFLIEFQYISLVRPQARQARSELALAVLWEVNLRFLWPVTPLGGLIIIIGWFLLLLSIVRMGKVYI